MRGDGLPPEGTVGCCFYSLYVESRCARFFSTPLIMLAVSHVNSWINDSGAQKTDGSKLLCTSSALCQLSPCGKGYQRHSQFTGRLGREKQTGIDKYAYEN